MRMLLASRGTHGADFSQPSTRTALDENLLTLSLLSASTIEHPVSAAAETSARGGGERIVK